MSRGRELVKNTRILFMAKASTQVISFLLLPLYTAILSTAEYGQLDIYSSLNMILLPFVTLQLEQGIFRFVISAKSKDETEDVITTALYTILISASIFSLAYLVLNLIIHLQYAFILYFYYLSLTISTVLLQVCRGFGKNVTYSVASFTSSAIAVVLNVIFIAGLRMGISGVIYATIIANIISSIYMIYKVQLFNYFRIRYFKINVLKVMLAYSVPLIFNQISSWIINYSDRLIILAFLGIGTNGIYSLASKFSNLLITFFGVYNIAWTENVVRCMDDKNYQPYLNNVATMTFQIYLCLVTGIINLLPLVFKYFVNSNYNNAYLHIPILLVAMFFSGMAATLGSIYVAYKRTKSIGLTTGFAGIINVVVHLSLIHFIGLYAASISTLVSFMALFLYRYFDMRKFERINLDYKRIVVPVCILAVSWIAYAVNNALFVIIGLLMNCLYVLFFLKKNYHKVLGVDSL